MSAKFVAGLRLAAPVLALALMVAPAIISAGAEEAVPPEPQAQHSLATGGKTSGKAFSAPVGHRQPRAADIPGQVPRDELAERIDRINRDLDRELQICRGC